MNNQKGFSPVMIVLILLVAAGGGWYIYSKSNNRTVSESHSPTTSIAASPDATDPVGWKTYRNEEHGFEFKYPSDWTTKSRISFGGYPSVISLLSPELQRDQSQANRKLVGDSDIDFIVTTLKDINRINSANGIQYGSFADYVQRDQFILQEKQASVNGYHAWTATLGGYGAYYTIFFEKDAQIYQILFERKDKEAALSNIERQILSTFKFTK